MFSEQFVKDLPENLLDAQVAVCRHFNETRKKGPAVEDYISASIFADIFVKTKGLDLSVPEWTEKLSDDENINRITNFFRNWHGIVEGRLESIKRKQIIEETHDRYSSLFGKGVFYEFSDTDYECVQNIINNLRNLIVASKDFEDEHKSRLLKKLEKLQTELHKRMSNFDAFWGFFIDSGIALTRFWENAKPFRDDVKEMAEIICRTQAKAEDIQKLSPFKFLSEGHKGEDNESNS